MQLYFSPNLNPRVAVAAARHLAVPLEFIPASPRDPAQIARFRALNPNALVPILVEDGQVLWETDAIVCRLSHLADSDFWRRGANEPRMMQWLSWAAHHLNRAIDPIYFERLIRPRFSDQPLDPAVLAEAFADYRRYAGLLDAELAGRRWLLGERLSYADFRVATVFPFAEASGLPLDEFPQVRRWHEGLLALDAWRAPFEGLPQTA
jgi:glutathione S-transferase